VISSPFSATRDQTRRKGCLIHFDGVRYHTDDGRLQSAYQIHANFMAFWLSKSMQMLHKTLPLIVQSAWISVEQGAFSLITMARISFFFQSCDH
jgi:hypothetical protein